MWCCGGPAGHLKRVLNVDVPGYQICGLLVCGLYDSAFQLLRCFKLKRVYRVPAEVGFFARLEKGKNVAFGARFLRQVGCLGFLLKSDATCFFSFSFF